MSKKKVKLFWNGNEIEAEEGSNLLKAALDNKIEVAHYCYHPGLSVAGVCRMCMVEQDGQPRLFPSCNATVQEGMKIRNDTAKVKDTVEWVLQLHLVNHPLDCTICDQAGECGLQELYMKHGKYDSTMVDEKVHKDKVVDVGRNVMLDKERCILCSRCVRFTDEVTKTHELGIVQRGDHAEITVNESFKNDYAMNTVDICPVGALTSKDFRFKQRVWFLEEVETTCIGCETGCRVKVSFNEKGAFRVKPVYDAEVNGHWMCDDGREIYKHVSRMDRLQTAMRREKDLFLATDFEQVKNIVKGKKIKAILSAGLTQEEYERFFNNIKGKNWEVGLFSLPPEGKEFDGLLKRADKNSNLRGAHTAFTSHGYNPSAAALEKILQNLNTQDVLLWVVPEFSLNQQPLKELAQKFSKAGMRVALTSNEAYSFLDNFDYLLPVPAFLEKEGTLFNYQEKARSLHRAKRSYGDVSKNVDQYGALL